MVSPSRFFTVVAVSLLGVLSVHFPAKSAERRSAATVFDEGDGWAIMREARQRACVGMYWFGNKGLTLTSSVFEGRMTYSISLSEKDRPPESRIYDLELRNEGSLDLRLLGKGFLNPDGINYVMSEPFGISELNAIARSRILDVATDGVGGGHYDLGSKCRAFGRFFDCLKANERTKPAPPKPRRMN